MKINNVKREEIEMRLEPYVLFWIERLFLFLLIIFPTYLLDLTIPIILFTTLYGIPFFFLCRNLYSVGSSGIGGIWLFILDRSTFYLAFQYYKLLAGGFDLTFLWRLTIVLSFVIHSIYIVEYLLRSHQTVPSTSPQSKNYDKTPGDVSKQVEKMNELVEDGKKMVTYMENMIHSSLETQRKEWGEFLDELSKDGKKTMSKLDGMICAQIGTLRENMRLNVDEVWQKLRDEMRSKVDENVKASRQDLNKGIKSMADQLRETYLAMEETTKEAKAYETYLIDQTNRRVIRGDDVEGFAELREQVQRMAVEAEIAAEELSRVTVELVEAGIQQWEDDNFDYLASLPLMYLNRN
ncbi:PREDICTED: uncharacterized protein LOC104751756 [Camelina sativa]|uniref:Uncharacterized protein LOC104751756 n=1 Tax=Camelina sativa TaxID=90675 RepID=A0ABM0WJR6_CAMSA|nr:PREDICTED: uncharacterized protein LOC104751756 [Camelina sativa]